MSATITTVVAAVRSAVHRPSAGPLLDADIVARANVVYPQLRRRLAMQVPELFMKATGDITVSDGTATYDLTASPTSLTDFGTLDVVEIKSGANYIPMRWSSPMEMAVNTGIAGTYRVRYLTKAATLVLASSTAIDMPDGFELVLIEELSAWVRRKFNESPNEHLQASKDAWREGIVSLLDQYARTPLTIVNSNITPWYPRFRLTGPTTVEFVGY